VETLVPRPIHLETHAADPERVQRFYGALFAYCKDSESNVFGMMQLDPSAA
jgi:predicted enzyme related to lactoylglutathione lyase